ncbi:MAG: 3-hydroxyacyl-ACP dehydratase FabZ [Pseudomonadota bacterium]
MTVEAEDTKTELDRIELDTLLRYLPHRSPFLMVERIINIRDWSCVGVKCIGYNEPQFQGHFPGKPIMPGVLIIEGMAQTSGALVMYKQGLPEKPLVYFLTIDKARFRKPVIPGDVLHYEVEKLKNRANIWKFKAVATVEGQKVAEAEVSAMIIAEEGAWE